MNRYNTKKRPFTIAVMIIFLCLMAISGATLALFTSDDDDGKIGINATAGDLKVDIVDTSPNNPASLVNEVLDFVVENDENGVLFEPGATYYTEGFRVKNDGDVPFKYILYISEDSSLSQDFSEAFDVWVTRDPTNRTVGEKLEKFEGELDADKMSEPYYLVFRMKETAGNEFQNRTFTGVGVTVCAVQANYQ